MIMHVVCHKYKDKAQAEVIAPILKSMVGQIPGLLSLDAGTDFLDCDRSYHLAIVAKLADREAFDVYATHPIHLKNKEYIYQFVTDSVSVDFEIKE